MSVSAHFGELGIKMILHEAPEIYGSVVLSAERCNLLCIIFLMRLPLVEIWSSVHVTEHAECSIWKKPMAISLHECLITSCSGEFCKSLVKGLPQHLQLGIVHSFIIDLRKSVKLSLELLVSLGHRHARCRKIDELRVKRERRVGIVRI